MLKLVHREFPIVASFAARLDKQISNKLLKLNDNSLIARYNYVLKTNYLFIHYTMLRVTNMLSDSARKTNQRDKCSKSASSTRRVSPHC